MGQDNTKIVGRESRLEEFAKGEVVKVKALEARFSFERGVYPSMKSFEQAIVYEKKDKSMLVIFREENPHTLITLQEYVLNDKGTLSMGWSTTSSSYEPSYKKYNQFLRGANL